MIKVLSILLFASILTAQSKTIAVSYFDNTSDIKEYNPLSKGLADMLITDLSNIKSINIVEREIKQLAKFISTNANFLNIDLRHEHGNSCACNIAGGCAVDG